jgi:hypothetical protein
MLKQTLVVGAILTGLAFPAAAIADETGTVSGGVAGAVGGAFVGGPVGAVVGGVGGAVVGNTVTNPPAEGRAAYVERYPGPMIPNANVPANSPYALAPQGQ